MTTIRVADDRPTASVEVVVLDGRRVTAREMFYGATLEEARADADRYVREQGLDRFPIQKEMAR